jgi:hypothetical protein
MDGAVIHTNSGRIPMANFVEVLKELEQERSRLDQAIEVLGTLAGRKTRTTKTKASRPRRTLSAAARKKIAVAQRARWAKWKATHIKKAA